VKDQRQVRRVMLGILIDLVVNQQGYGLMTSRTGAVGHCQTENIHWSQLPVGVTSSRRKKRRKRRRRNPIGM